MNMEMEMMIWRFARRGEICVFFIFCLGEGRVRARALLHTYIHTYIYTYIPTIR